MTDPIADLLARVRNAQHAGHPEVSVPHSQIKLELVKLLRDEGFLASYKTEVGEGERKTIRIGIRYGRDGKPVIREMRRVSRPGLRIYRSYDKIPVVRNGMGLVLLSTSKGILTDRQARQAKVGGEILLSVV